MKLIYIMSDSMRRDHISAYGNPPWFPIRTPNFQRFADGAAVFDRAYIGSFPTVPNRRDTLLGKADQGKPLNRWKGLEKDEKTLPAYLREKGIPTQLILDTQNNVKPGIDLGRDYDAVALNPGQEGEAIWMSDRVELEYECPPKLVRYGEDGWKQILVNRKHRRQETDWFAPGTYTMAMDWLADNYSREAFFLWIDTFDPHEPWDPPQHYIDMYDPGYEGRVFEAPTYGIRKHMDYTDRELQHTRARYAGEVTMVDTWFGHLMNRLESLGIAEETAIIYTSDHGTCFDGPGDCGMVQKMSWFDKEWLWMAGGRKPILPVRYISLPVHCCRIPLMMKIPGATPGARIPQTVQPWDVSATILDYFGIDVPSDFLGTSLLPLVRGESGGPGREVAIVGRSGSDWDPAKGFIQAMDDEWIYTLYRDACKPSLHHISVDPECETNLAGQVEHAATEARYREQIFDFIRSQGIGQEFIDGYTLE
jgi:arylsulfatase A-like enzyme